MTGDIEDTKKTINDYIEWIFSHISIVVLIPSFLGAVWQILELSRINVAYIRFFSISQIPIDGTLILFLLIFLFGMSKITMALIKHSFEKKIETFEDESILEKTKLKLNQDIIIASVVCIILICSTAYFIPTLYADMFPNAPIATILLVYVNIAGLMLYLAQLFVLIGVKLGVKDKDTNHDVLKQRVRDFLDRHKQPILWSFVFSLMIIISTFFVLLKLFSQSFILPTNLYNTKNLEAIIYNEFKTKDYNVEYFNDKYIFVELCTINKCSHPLDREIVIYPTEKVLFKTTYGKVWTGYFTTSEPVDN